MKMAPALVVFMAFLLWNSLLIAAGPTASPLQKESTPTPGFDPALLNLNMGKCLDLALKITISDRLLSMPWKLPKRSISQRSRPISRSSRRGLPIPSWMMTLILSF